jgi:hypothetical protein
MTENGAKRGLFVPENGENGGKTCGNGMFGSAVFGR